MPKSSPLKIIVNPPYGIDSAKTNDLQSLDHIKRRLDGSLESEQRNAEGELSSSDS